MAVITFLSDYGHRRRVRRRLPRRDPAARCPDARIVDITHGIDRHDVRTGALTLAACASLHAARRAPGRRRSRRGRGDRRAVALRVVAGLTGILVGPDNGLLSPAALTTRRRGGRRSTSGHSPHRAPNRCPRRFHGRDLFAPVAAAARVGRHSLSVRRRPGREADSLTSTLDLPLGAASRDWGAGRSRPWAATASATPSSTARSDQLSAARRAAGAQRRGGRRRPALARTLRADLRRGRARRAARLRGLAMAHALRSPSTAAPPWTVMALERDQETLQVLRAT